MNHEKRIMKVIKLKRSNLYDYSDAYILVTRTVTTDGS